MAKIAFSKLNAKINTDIKTIALEDGKEIEIIQYLPTSDKINFVTRVIELAHDLETNYMNPIKTNIYFNIELITAYTNITFTEKQLENIPKLYDLLLSSGWLEKIRALIPVEERDGLWLDIQAVQNAYYAYRNSVAGILEHISTDYSNLNFDITELQKKLNSGEGIELVKSIVDNLG